MCGINGLIGEDTMRVARMNEATRHRGPDATSVWTDGKVTLGANRLAIIDLSASANQPLHTPDGRFTIVFNGEIYNYRELRRTLEHSYQFTTHGDTEVVLALFAREGPNAFAKLNGMFGLAIWDAREQVLTLARDQSGIKPLYYRWYGHTFAFSSEIQGIIADPNIPRHIDREALELYLRLRYVPEPYTLIDGIKKLSPASYAVWKDGSLTLRTYFEPRLQPRMRISAAAAADEIRTRIDASVKGQLVSERPVGIFLSGGLDSSIILDAAMNAGGTMQTFSLGFELSAAEEAAKFNADMRIARETARVYGAVHHELLLSEHEFVDLLPSVVRYLDQPIANATAVAQYALAHFARERIVVALQGDGGDELFGGYPRYRLNRIMDLYQKLPPAARRICERTSDRLRKLNTPAGIARFELFHFEKDALLSRAVTPNMLSERPRRWFETRYLRGRDEVDSTQLLMDIDRRSWLADEALARTDTMTMGASLEARVPLLDPEIVLFASRLPTSQRVGFRTNKALLRRAYAARLPRHVRAAKKRGFFSPTAKWLRRPRMRALAREVLAKGYDRNTDALLTAGALRLLDDHVAGAYAVHTLWSLIVFRMWARARGARL